MTSSTSKLISIVIPCFNNEEELQDTVRKISDQFGSGPLSAYSLEIILVDDASKDDTWNVICSLQSLNDDIRAIRLSSNVGAYIAILAGLDCAKGNGIIVMAADGDDPPELISDLITKWKAPYQLVLANRITSNEVDSNSIFGSLFYKMAKCLGAKNIPEGGSDFILVSRELLDQALYVGWQPGNTLIQLFQLADATTLAPYDKKLSKKSGWTFRKKASLFIQTLYNLVVKPKTRPANFFYSISETI